MCRGVGLGVTVEKRCLATALRAAQRGGPGDVAVGAILRSSQQALRKKKKVHVPQRARVFPSSSKSKMRRKGGSADLQRAESLLPCMGTPAGRVFFWSEGGGNLFFACADWLTGACIIPYKCKYFSFHSPVTVLFLPQSSPFLNPFSSHLPPSLSRSSLSLSTFLLFLLFGY